MSAAALSPVAVDIHRPAKPCADTDANVEPDDFWRAVALAHTVSGCDGLELQVLRGWRRGEIDPDEADRLCAAIDARRETVRGAQETETVAPDPDREERRVARAARAATRGMLANSGHIPPDVDRGLTNGARALYLIILEETEGGVRSCTASLAELARRAHLTKSGARKARAELVRAGVITMEQRRPRGAWRNWTNLIRVACESCRAWARKWWRGLRGARRARVHSSVPDRDSSLRDGTTVRAPNAIEGALKRWRRLISERSARPDRERRADRKDGDPETSRRTTRPARRATPPALTALRERRAEQVYQVAGPALTEDSRRIRYSLRYVEDLEREGAPWGVILSTIEACTHRPGRPGRILTLAYVCGAVKDTIRRHGRDQLAAMADAYLTARGLAA